MSHVVVRSQKHLRSKFNYLRGHVQLARVFGGTMDRDAWRRHLSGPELALALGFLAKDQRGQELTRRTAEARVSKALSGKLGLHRDQVTKLAVHLDLHSFVGGAAAATDLLDDGVSYAEFVGRLEESGFASRLEPERADYATRDLAISALDHVSPIQERGLTLEAEHVAMMAELGATRGLGAYDPIEDEAVVHALWSEVRLRLEPPPAWHDSVVHLLLLEFSPCDAEPEYHVTCLAPSDLIAGTVAANRVSMLPVARTGELAPPLVVRGPLGLYDLVAVLSREHLKLPWPASKPHRLSLPQLKLLIRLLHTEQTGETNEFEIRRFRYRVGPGRL